MSEGVKKLAVVTGATSGIGAEFARQLAIGHQEIWLIGRREEKLQQLSAELAERYQCDAKVMIRDLGDREVIAQLAAEMVEQEHLTTLINNAGYAEDGDFHAMEWQQHDAIMNVHVDATLRLSHAALSVMVPRNRGDIINVASVASFIPTPSSPLYGPTKTYIRALSETLAAKYNNGSIRIQALCPGFTITDFHERIGIDPKTFYKSSGLMRSWTSSFVVNCSLEDLDRGRAVSVPGWNYKLAVAVLRHLPLWSFPVLFGGKKKSHRYALQKDGS